MKYCVIDSSYRKSIHIGIAAQFLLWMIKKNNKDLSNVSDADIILITCPSQQGVNEVKIIHSEVKKINTKAKIILGGAGLFAPISFDKYMDCACIGEGTHFLIELFDFGYDAVLKLAETYYPGIKKQVVPNVEFDFNIPPILHPDGFYRCFASRGCPNRCLFCQTSWETCYRKNPDMEKLSLQINGLKKRGKKISLITNDGARDGSLNIGHQEFVSATFKELKKIKITKSLCRSVRIGVEGVSERLRSAVKKPINADELIELSYNAIQNRVGVRWFFIKGLPYETQKDWDELKYTVSQLHKFSSGVIMMNFHSYIPQPATPLCIFPLVDEYWERFEDFRKWFFDGIGFTRHVQILASNKYESRMRRAKESMGTTEKELREGWFDSNNKNWIIKYCASPDRLRQLAKQYKTVME